MAGVNHRDQIVEPDVSRLKHHDSSQLTKQISSGKRCWRIDRERADLPDCESFSTEFFDRRSIRGLHRQPMDRAIANQADAADDSPAVDGNENLSLVPKVIRQDSEIAWNAL